jgi:hypothetical protein
MDYLKQFYVISKIAIEKNLITEHDRDTISRVGTRKEGYWARHLLDLCDFLELKKPDGDVETLIRQASNYLRRHTMGYFNRLERDVRSSYSDFPKFTCKYCGKRLTVIGFKKPVTFDVLCINPDCPQYDQVRSANVPHQ